MQEAREFIDYSCRRAETKYNRGPNNPENQKALSYIKVWHADRDEAGIGIGLGTGRCLDEWGIGLGTRVGDGI